MALSDLRPLGLGELLDGAFTLYRRHFTAFATTALVVHLPVVALQVAFGFGAVALSPGAVALTGLAAFVALLLAVVLGAGALTHQASAAYLGGPVDPGPAIRAAGGRFFTLWGTLFVQGVIVGIGLLLLVVPGLLFLARYFAMVPAVVLEGKSSSTSQPRSRELSAGAVGPILGTLLVVTIVTWMPVLGLNTVLAALARYAPLSGLGAPGVPEVLGTLAQCLAMPFQLIAVTLLYYDRRVRTEALDLVPAAPDAAPAFS